MGFAKGFNSGMGIGRLGLAKKGMEQNKEKQLFDKDIATYNQLKGMMDEMVSGMAETASKSPEQVANFQIQKEEQDLLYVWSQRMDNIAQRHGLMPGYVQLKMNEIGKIKTGAQQAIDNALIDVAGESAGAQARANDPALAQAEQALAQRQGINAGNQSFSQAQTENSLGLPGAESEADLLRLNADQTNGVNVARGQAAGTQRKAQDEVYIPPPNPAVNVNLTPPVVDQDGRIVGTATQSQVNPEAQSVHLYDRAIGTIDEMLANIEADPSISGIVGAARQKGSKLAGAVDQFTEMFGFDMIKEPFVRIASDARKQAQQDLVSGDISDEEYSDFFSPGISEQEVMENSVAYIYAKAQQGSGRLLKDAIKDSKQAVKTTGLFGPGTAKANLMKVRDLIANAKQDAEARIGVPSDAGGPAVGQVEDGYEFIGGDPADPNSWKKL